MKYWDPEEIAKLKAGAHLGMPHLLRNLPGRSKLSIQHKACDLSLRIPRVHYGLPNQWTGKIPVPETCSHEVRRLYEAMNAKGLTIERLSTASRNAPDMIKSWRKGHDPRVSRLKAALNEVGLDLVVVPLKEETRA